MDPKLRKHLLDESRTMLVEARSALQRSTDQLMMCIADVENGEHYHPVRKSFQRKTLGETNVKTASSHVPSTTTKRAFSLMGDDENGGADQLEETRQRLAEAERVEQAHRTLLALEHERNELARLELERAEQVKVEAEKAEKLRVEAERALEQERLMLTKIEAEKADLRKRIEQEKLELQRIEKEKQEMALEEETRKRNEEEQLEVARVAKEEDNKRERERLEKERSERLKREEDERKERLLQEEQERKIRLDMEEKQRQERLAQEEHDKHARLLAEEQERETRQEIARLERQVQAIELAAVSSNVVSPNVETEEEMALREALAEQQALEHEELEASRMAEAEEESPPQAVPDGLSEYDEEELPTKDAMADHHHEVDTSFEYPKGSSSTSLPSGEKKYVTIQDRMLQPRRNRVFPRAPRERVLVLREDKFRYYDENQKQMLGGLSLAEEGVEVVLTAFKKSPSGVALRFSSPSAGTLEFYPATELMGKKWISAIEHNMEMRYELPDLGPEEAPTFYDYLGVPPEEADPPTLLQAYADRSRSARDEWLRAKLNEALQVLHDPFKKVEYDNFVMVQRKYRFGGVSTVQIRTPRGESTDAVLSRVFTDASFSYLYWQDLMLGPSLTGRHLCVELVRVQEVQPGTTNGVQLLLNNGEVLIFTFKEKREAEDFGAAIRFAKSPQLSAAKRRTSVQETSV